MERLRDIAKEAAGSIDTLLGGKLSEKQTDQIREIIEKSVIKGLLEGQHQAVDAALEHPEADQDIAHKIATAIRQRNDAIIANLSSMR